MGDLDGALTAWTEFLDCAEGVQSVRARDAAEGMRVRLARHQHVSEARDPTMRTVYPERALSWRPHTGSPCQGRLPLCHTDRNLCRPE